MTGDKPTSGLDSTVAPSSGLESTVTPPLQKPISEAPTVGPTLPSSAHDLPDLPIVDDGFYVIGTEIGRGGMGRVLSARDRRLRRDVVIKVLHHAAAAARFQREALITAKLQHPSIVRVYDAGWLGGEPFYAMERVRGTSLDRVVATTDDFRARLSLLPHVIAVAEAIAYAHSEGVIHRDLKPHNVLVGSFGETVVIDWGLAKDLRSSDVESLEPRLVVSGSDQTVAGSVMGTPSFMPPEQARGEPADERSDIYALGAMLYYVLCGAPPTSGERALDDAKAGSITPLREREASIPPELASIVDRAMAFSPLDRFGSAKDFANELERYSAGQLVSSHEYSTATLLKRWIKRHRTVLSVVTIAIVLLAILGVFSIRKIMEKSDLAEANAREVSHQMDLVKQRSDELLLDHAESTITSDPSTAIGLLRGLSTRAMGEPRAHAIANAAAANGASFELAGPRDDIEQLAIGKNGVMFTGSDDGHLWGWSIASKRGDDLGAAHTGPIEAMAIASNGVLLVTGGTDSMVRLWDLVTGESRLLSGHTAGVRGLAFAPDNATFVSTSEDHTLRQWSIASGEGKVLVADKYPLRPLLWHPDGTRLWAGAGDGRVVEVELASGKVTAIRVHGDEVRALALSPDGKWLASGGEDGGVFVTMIDTDSPRARPSTNTNPTPSGTRLGSSAADHQVRKLATHADVVRDVLWTRDGTRVISAGGDQRVVVTPLAGKPLELLGNMSGVKDLVLSPDGTHVAAAGIDGVARIWPVTGGEPRALRGHRGSVKCVELTDDLLITTSDDDRVRIWPLAPPPPAPSGPALAAWIEQVTNVR